MTVTTRSAGGLATRAPWPCSPSLAMRGCSPAASSSTWSSSSRPDDTVDGSIILAVAPRPGRARRWRGRAARGLSGDGSGLFGEAADVRLGRDQGLRGRRLDRRRVRVHRRAARRVRRQPRPATCRSPARVTTFVVDGTHRPVRQGSDADPAAERAAGRRPRSRSSITFPGDVDRAATASEDGNTVTWTPAPARRSRSPRSAGRGRPPWTLIGAALALLALVVVGVVLIVVVRGRQSAPRPLPGRCRTAASFPDPERRRRSTR